MSDERDEKDDPVRELRQGLGHLWRAARGVASTVKKEVDRTSVGKVIDDAGREFARAANNVVGRITEEIGKHQGPPTSHEPHAPRDEAPEWQAPPKVDDEEDEFDGVRPTPKGKATGPTPEDPGFRIAIDDDEKKPPR